MRMQKGICIELHGDRSVYMLPNGQFATGRPQKGTAVGEEAYFVPSAARSRIKRAMPILAAVAVLFILISTLAMPAKEAYGYVQVESNPGIELGIDEEGRVISARELNEDGGQLIERLGEWENRSLEQVLQRVLALSVDDDTEQVTITTVQAQDDTKTIDTVERITLAALTANSDRQLQIHLKEANKEQWRQAKKQQVPVARFVEKDRTFTSPGQQDHEVQPAQDAESRTEKANREDPRGEPKDIPAAEPERKEPAPADQKAINKEPVPATPESKEKNEQKPSLPKTGNGNAPKQPAAKDGAEKAHPSSEEKPKNPNAGKGNNSGEPKPPGKSSENPGTPPQDKGSKNRGNGQPKEKADHQENKGSQKNEPQEQEDGHESDPAGPPGSENGKGAAHKEKSSTNTENGKNHKPNQEKPLKSSEE